jgi:hypothetical protein
MTQTCTLLHTPSLHEIKLKEKKRNQNCWVMTTTTTTTFPFRISRALERTIEQGGVLLAVVERADDRVVVERHFGHLEIRIDHHLQNRIFTQKKTKKSKSKSIIFLSPRGSRNPSANV